MMEYVIGALLSMIGFFAWNFFQIKKDRDGLAADSAKGVIDGIKSKAEKSVAEKSLEDLVDDINHRYPPPPDGRSGDDHS